MIWPSSGFGWLLSASICAIMRAKAVESCFGLIATRLEHIFECVFMLNKEEPTPQQSRRGHGTAKAGQTLMSFTGAPPKGGDVTTGPFVVTLYAGHPVAVVACGPVASTPASGSATARAER